MTKLKEKANHFWREIDHRDFLLLATSFSFFTFIVIGLVMLLMGMPIDPMYIELLSMMTPILITITSGIFGVSAIQTFKGDNKEVVNKSEVAPTTPKVEQPSQQYYYEPDQDVRG